MSLLRPLSAAIVFFCAQSAMPVRADASAAPARIAIRCGSVIDVVAGRKLGPQTIVVNGNTIEKIVASPGDDTVDRVIDLHTRTCMPGWIDAHVHLTFEVGPKFYEEITRLNAADYALRGAKFARNTLRAGFTTVRNLGDIEGIASVALRNAIDAGDLEGPRILTAGQAIATTGGHADTSNGLKRTLARNTSPRDGVINGVDQAYAAVRERYKEGADLIKVTATAGVLSQERSADNAQFSAAELNAVVAAAHDYGFRVAAHAHGDEGIRRAVLAGVDSIEHGTYASDATLRLMKERGTSLVPTLSAAEFLVVAAQKTNLYPEPIKSKALAVGSRAGETVARAHRAGVRIAYGTDSGAIPHGRNAREFDLLVAAGLPTIEALRAATIYAAELLGQDQRIGSLEPGKLADIVAVDGDPLSDIAATHALAFVMKDGHVVIAP